MIVSRDVVWMRCTVKWKLVFEKVEQATMAIIQNAARQITEQITTNEAGIPITVFHAGGLEATRSIELELETDAIHFSEMHFELIPDELAKLPEQSFRLETSTGEEIRLLLSRLAFDLITIYQNGNSVILILRESTN